jgi:hypothetical protein
MLIHKTVSHPPRPLQRGTKPIGCYTAVFLPFSDLLAKQQSNDWELVPACLVHELVFTDFEFMHPVSKCLLGNVE